MNERKHSVDHLTNNILSYYRDKDIEDDFGSSDVTPHAKHFEILTMLLFSKFNLIDEAIALKFTNNNNDVLNSILRVGVCELLYLTDVPSKVVINEYSNIADSLSTNVGVVNSVLDCVAKERP